MTHFAVVNIVYSSKFIVKKAGTHCLHNLPSLCYCVNCESFSLLLLQNISASTKSRLCVDIWWKAFR